MTKELTDEMNYRIAVIEAINSLEKSKKDIFEKLANVAMAGEFSEIDKLFEERESVSFIDDYFKDCKDINVGFLSLITKTIVQVRKDMIRNNNISDDELTTIVKT